MSRRILCIGKITPTNAPPVTPVAHAQLDGGPRLTAGGREENHGSPATYSGGTAMSHAPTPWEVHIHPHVTGEFWCTIGRNGFGPITDIVGEEGNKTRYYQPVAAMKYLVTPVEEQKANAEFIVRAVNSHELLLAACKSALKLSHITIGSDVADLLREAIEAAEGKPCDL